MYNFYISLIIMTNIEYTNIISIPNSSIVYEYLLYYNIVFYYHNESIELLDYYLKNLQFLFTNISNTDKNEILFGVNFFVSNLDFFIQNLTSKYTNYQKSNKLVHKIYENNKNYIETIYCTIKFDEYNFYINVHEIISKPYNINFEQSKLITIKNKKIKMILFIMINIILIININHLTII